MTNELKIFQCNIQSLQKNKEELSRILIQDQYHVALISETWSKKELEDTKYKISNFYTYLDSRADGKGGAAIFINKKYKTREISIPTFDKIQCLARQIVSLDLVVVSIYISPNVNNTELKANLKQIFDKIKCYRKVFVGGDFNAHHFTWDRRISDTKGAIVMDIINESNFLILNKGDPTFVPVELNKRSTAIDLAMATSALYQDLEMNVLDHGIGGSRHLALATTMQGVPDKPNRHFINRKKVHEQLQKLDTNEVGNLRDLQKKVKTIVKNSKQKDKYNPKFWWNEEVELAWKAKIDARTRYNKTSGIPELIEFKKAECLFNRVRERSKTEKFNEFVKSIDPSTPSKILWSDIRRLTGRQKNKRDNVLIHEDRSLATQFMDKHFPLEDWSDTELRQYSTSHDIINREKWNNFLERKKKPSAPGPDGISYDILKHIPMAIQDTTIRELNEVWRTGRFPIELKTISIVAIPKPGKNPETLEGTRPLSMLSCLIKTLNAAVLTEYQEFLDEKQLLPELSFGFRKKMSTNTCLSFVTNEISRIKRDKKVAAAVFVDLSNAFNMVKIDTLELLLFEQRTPPEFSNYFVAFLRDRRLQLQVGTEMITRTVSNGLPQGDILSPTLFNVYTANLHHIRVGGVILVQYADDFAILIEGKNIADVQEKAQEFLTLFEERAKHLNFVINTDKTKAMVFQANDKTLDVKINGLNVETVNTYKYLGITLDKSLRFRTHIRDLKRRSITRLNMIKVISSARGGGHPSTLGLVFNGIMRNFVEYGSGIYGVASKSNLESLKVVNNQCLRKITGCTKSTPLNTLHAIAAQEPPEFRRVYIVGKDLVKQCHYRSVVWNQLETSPHNYTEGCNNFTFIEKVLEEHRPIFNSLSRAVRSTDVRDNVAIEINLHEGSWSKKVTSEVVLRQLALGLIHGKYAGRQIIYTDASKFEDTCGIGIFHERGNFRLSLKLQNPVCIMSAEIEAIYVALQYITRNRLQDSVIMTDSKSGCQFIQNGQVASERDETVEDILRMASASRTTIQWIPGHVKIAGNEVADQLAKAGLNQVTTAKNNIFIHDAINYFQQFAATRSQEWYVNYTAEQGKGRKYFALQNTIPEKPWHHGLALENGEVRTLNRIFSGHDYSRYGLYKIRIENDCLCDICEEIEDAKHLILFCVKYLIPREKYELDRFNTLDEIYATKDVNILRNVTRFLKEIKKKI